MTGLSLFSLVAVLATLVVLLAINRGFFSALGWARTLQWLLIWGAIIAALVLVASIVGVPEQFQRDRPTVSRERF